MRILILSLTAAGLLAGCDATTNWVMPGPPVPVPVTDSCGATALQPLIGQPVTVLPDAGVWSSIRVIRPGQAVTMDFSATRLNVEVDAAGRMIRIFCG